MKDFSSGLLAKRDVTRESKWRPAEHMWPKARKDKRTGLVTSGLDLALDGRCDVSWDSEHPQESHFNTL